MPAYNFQPQFEPLIIQGIKTTTIRRPRKRPTVKGDNFTATVHGRTKNCRVILRSKVDIVLPCRIDESGIKIAHRMFTGVVAEKLAVSDGFDGFPGMRAWFAERYGLPFEGEIISWKGDHA